MKEKKSDSFSFFRKSGSRYSFTSEKKKKQQQDDNTVQIRRLSWTSFPLIKVSVPEEMPKTNSFLPSRLSQSSENLKKQAKTLNSLSKSKSSSFFKSSSTTVKNIFNASSSSTSVSSSNSSASSSPKIRESWSSGVTNILERVDSDTNDPLSTREDEINPYDVRNSGTIATFNSISKKDLTKPKLGPSYSRNYFPSTSLMDEENEGEIMCTPKIICAHKKTPDATRKSRRQIIQELEYIKELGMLPEEIEPIVITNVKENENSSPNYENFPFALENLNLNSFKGYKASEETPNFNKQVSNISKSNQPFLCPTQDATLSLVADGSQGDSLNNSNLSSSSISDSNCSSSSSNTINGSSSDITLNSTIDCKESSLNNEYICPETNISFGVTTTSTDNENTLVDKCTSNPLENSSLNSISVEEEDSEGDEDSETMTTIDDDDNSTFETRLEDDLEKLTDRRNSNGLYLDRGNAVSDEEETVQLRRKSKPNLHIDIEKARSQKTFSNDRLRRIADDSSDSARSSRSSPRTPRSPAIDIDILFKQRQKKIEESSKDNLTQVKDLTQRLRLSTQSSPTHIEWLNGIKNKSDARQLAEVMSPVILENPEGIFQLQEADEGLTEEQREKNLTKALVWIKDELTKMKEQDQTLARQLVQLQLEMQRLRLHRSCTQHEALLEEVTCEEEEQKALMTSTDLIDLPSNFRECAFLSLRDFGVTRMNIANRRFTLR